MQSRLKIESRTFGRYHLPPAATTAMNPKIAQHQQHNAQTRLRQRYTFLNIADIQSTDGDIAQRFADSGIYRIERPAAARFPFHQNGEIDRAFHQAQHQAARAETVRRILALHADTA